MPSTCVVLGCRNRSDRETDKKFHRFPALRSHEGIITRELSERRRREWLAQIRRRDITFNSIKDHHRVCSDHFITGEPGWLHKTADPDWIPTQKLGHRFGKKPDIRATRLAERERQKQELAATKAWALKLKGKKSQELLQQEDTVKVKVNEEKQIVLLEGSDLHSKKETQNEMLQDLDGNKCVEMHIIVLDESNMNSDEIMMQTLLIEESIVNSTSNEMIQTVMVHEPTEVMQLTAYEEGRENANEGMETVLLQVPGVNPFEFIKAEVINGLDVNTNEVIQSTLQDYSFVNTKLDIQSRVQEPNFAVDQETQTVMTMEYIKILEEQVNILTSELVVAKEKISQPHKLLWKVLSARNKTSQ